MTIIVAFILDAFVFRMNYSRKNREPVDNPEGQFEPLYSDYSNISILNLIEYGWLCFRWKRDRVWSRGEPGWGSDHAWALQADLPDAILPQLSDRSPTSHGQERGTEMPKTLLAFPMTHG